MKIEALSVKNYRALKDVNIPMSHFVCLTGENNAGKSSLLQALSLFLRGTALTKSNYFDPNQEIWISADLTEISDTDLCKLSQEHRVKIDPLVVDGKLTLERRWGVDGKSQFGYIGLVPIAERFQEDFIKLQLERQKPSAAFRLKILENYPELAEQITNASTQAVVRDAIKLLGEAEPPDRKERRYAALPTGAPLSILPMLPEPIYIPAVKDLRDETKTNESSPFGKILSIVMDWIEPDLGDTAKIFEELSNKLTRITNAEGIVEDKRLPDIQSIENKMQSYLQESFSNVSLELYIPPPDIKTVLSGAQIFADDGVKGPLDMKGDGLRRAIVFSILRTYVDFAALKEKRRVDKENKEKNPEFVVGQSEENDPGKESSYLLLYEEPELFLHPDAQRILFAAMRIFSQKHQVVVTTHSPLFLAPESTETFVRLSKTTAQTSKPFTVAHPVKIALDTKDAFQIICFENNNAAFFAKRIVLVEGDTDVIIFPHIARALNPDWDCAKHSVTFAKILGKGNIRRYKKFFSAFGVQIFLIGDLDIINEGFEHIEPDEELDKLHRNLNDCINDAINNVASEPNAKVIKEAKGKNNLIEVWEEVKSAQKTFENDSSKFELLNNAVQKFFAFERKNDRRRTLKEADNPDVMRAKSKLLTALRRSNVFLLEKGDIENYYPKEVTGKDKPSKAQSFCNIVKDRDQVIACCSEITCYETNQTKPEFEFIFESIFKPLEN